MIQMCVMCHRSILISIVSLEHECRCKLHFILGANIRAWVSYCHSREHDVTCWHNIVQKQQHISHRSTNYVLWQWGYNQIFIAKENVHKTTFRCPEFIGLFEWVGIDIWAKECKTLVRHGLDIPWSAGSSSSVHWWHGISIGRFSWAHGRFASIPRENEVVWSKDEPLRLNPVIPRCEHGDGKCGRPHTWRWGRRRERAQNCGMPKLFSSETRLLRARDTRTAGNRPLRIAGDSRPRADALVAGKSLKCAFDVSAGRFLGFIVLDDSWDS
jgi:hypothetical protein